MDAVSVRPISGRSELNDWVSCPRDFYPRSSPWVSPLDSDLRRLLDRGKNPFFRHGEAVPLLARDKRNRVVGRLLAHIYRRHNVRYRENAVFFGFFEAVDDQHVAAALLNAAAAYGSSQHGCTILRGPFNMTAMQEMGTLVEGFDVPPSVDETYTPPYHMALLSGAGLRPTFPVTTFRVDDITLVDPDQVRAGRVREGPASRLRIRPTNMRQFNQEIETLRELLNDSFYDNPYFVPITRDEFLFQIGPYRRLLDPSICLLAELDGVPCGFIIAVPDFNPLVKRMNGKLGPRQLVGFLAGRSRIFDVTLIIMGVQRHLQGRGIMRVLLAELLLALRKRNYRRLTVTWVADANHKSIASCRAIGGRPLHRLTLYEGSISPEGAISQ